MKRDMDLVRAILLKVEDAEEPLDLDELCEDEAPSKVAYHAALMIERGLLDGDVKRQWDWGVACGEVRGLTWDGQDYLDAVRDERVWSKTRKAIRESVGSCTFDTIKAVCSSVAVKVALGAVGMA